jgi:hypothetical protein
MSLFKNLFGGGKSAYKIHENYAEFRGDILELTAEEDDDIAAMLVEVGHEDEIFTFFITGDGTAILAFSDGTIVPGLTDYPEVRSAALQWLSLATPILPHLRPGVDKVYPAQAEAAIHVFTGKGPLHFRAPRKELETFGSPFHTFLAVAPEMYVTLQDAQEKLDAGIEPEEPADKAPVFSTVALGLEKSLIQVLAQGAEVSEKEPNENGTREFNVRWPGLLVRIFDTPGWDRDAQVNGLKGWIHRAAGGPPYSPAVQALLPVIDRTVHCYGISIEPAFDDQGRARQLVSDLARRLEGYIFSHQSLYTAEGNRVIGDPNDPPTLGPKSPGSQLERKERIEQHKAREASEDAIYRRNRTIARLRNEGVPVIEHLPVIADESEALIRPKEEVARRAIAVAICAVKGEGMEQAQVLGIVERYQATPFFSPAEQDFINDPAPSEHDRIQFCWRYECLWVFLWALGFVEKLARPDQVCDAGTAVRHLVDHSTESFIAAARLRSIEEILDEADLAYRYDWAAVDARVKGQPAPAGLDGGIIKERHYALNWLIGYMNEAWDDVSTDT